MKPIKLKCTNFHLRAKMSEDRFSYEVSREQWEMEHDPAYNKWLDNNAQWWADYDRAMSRLNKHCDAKEAKMKAPKNEVRDFEKHPVGTVTTVCTKVLDLGTHYNEIKQKNERKLRIDFESTELMKSGDYEGKPFLLINNFNFSMYQNSRLCQFIEAWLGRKFTDQNEADDFDLDELLGKTALCNVIHSDDGKWVNIGSIMPVPTGMKAPDAVGEFLNFDCDAPDMKVFEKLSDKVKEKIAASHEVMNPKSKQSDERNPPPADFQTDTAKSQDFGDVPF